MPCWMTSGYLQDAMDEEPLDIGRVVLSDSVAADIRRIVNDVPRQQRAFAMKDVGDMCELVKQVLSFDLRSLHRRKQDIRDTYQVCVAGLLIEYVLLDGYVRVLGASVAQ